MLSILLRFGFYFLAPGGFVADYEVAHVGYQAERLAQNQDGVVAYESVRHDDGRADDADDPEAGRKHRFAVLAAHEPLVDEPQREQHLPGAAVDDEPHRDVVDVEEMLHEPLRVAGHIRDGYDRSDQQQHAQYDVHTLPYAFHVQVPQVYVVADELAQHYGKIVAQPAVDAQQVGAADAQDPEDGGRQHLLGLLRQNPLHQDARREETLRHESDAVYQQLRQTHANPVLVWSMS